MSDYPVWMHFSFEPWDSRKHHKKCIKNPSHGVETIDSNSKLHQRKEVENKAPYMIKMLFCCV